MPLERYTTFGGNHADTAGLRNILASYGVVSPHTGTTPSEALLLGLGGGVGGGYFVFQYGKTSTFWLGTRGIWYKVAGEFQKRIVTRLGGRVEVKQSNSRPQALSNLVESLDAGKPVITWVNQAALPYLTDSPAYGAYFYYSVVVCGRDPAKAAFEIDDIAPRPWVVGADDLAATRASIPSQKNRTLTVVPPKKPFELKKAIRAGIADCVADMLKPRMQNFGLPAIAKWASLVNDPKDKRGWPKLFPPGHGLSRSLYHTFHLIETSGTGGGGFRGMYADFLDEAADALGTRRLREIARQYRALASMWTELAETALPDRAPAFKDMKYQARRKLELIQRQGPTAEAQIKKIADAGRSGGTDFPLSDEETRELLDAMQQQLRKIHDAEKEAITELKKLVS